MALDSIESAIEALKQGRMIVVVDDEDRENEGDLVMAAEFVSAEDIAFFLQHTSGLICTTAMSERLERLELPQMVDDNTDVRQTAFAVTVDARSGTTTGVSASDRATTVAVLADDRAIPTDLARPGHMHVLRACEGGVLERAGHTEASVDLCRLAGLVPMAIICEVVTSDKREMARLSELRALATRFDLPLVSIADLVAHRRKTEQSVAGLSA